MKKFHHIGLLTNEEQPKEMYFESLNVYATNPDDDPVNKIEWLRFQETGDFIGTPVSEGPHVAFLVDDLDAEIAGIDASTIVIPPKEVAPGIRISYFWQDGILVEYLEVKE